MGGRTLQLTLLVVVGAGLALLVIQPWDSDVPVARPMPALPSQSGTSARVAAPAHPNTKEVSPPPARSFHLPVMASASAVRTEAAPDAAATVLVPKDWMLRGTGPQNYDVRSDKAEVLSGQASVRFVSRKQDIPNTEFGSLIQTVIADPWLGKRVVFTVNWKPKGFRQDVQLWVQALDASRVVIAYNEVLSRYAKEQWQRSSVALDVPWSATEIVYGVNMRGTGQINIDGARFDVVDKSIDINARTIPGALGVVAQETSDKGPLASPSNMDFEDIVPVETTLFREVPKDRLGRSRF
jgi:hypothetical protein